MDAASINVEPERLRYITRSVLALQAGGGLTWAALGLFFFATDVRDLLPGRFTAFLLIAFAGVSAYLAYRYMPEYYERRFGHVDPPESSMSPRGAVIFLILVVLFLLYLFIWPFIGIAFGRRLDLFFGNLGDQFHILIHDPGHLVRFGPILYCTLIAICGFPWRGENRDRALLWLMNLEVFFWIVFFLYPLQHPPVAQMLPWRIVSAGWLGISLMTFGLFEHIRVVFLLPNRPQDQTEL